MSTNQNSTAAIVSGMNFGIIMYSLFFAFSRTRVIPKEFRRSKRWIRFSELYYVSQEKSNCRCKDAWGRIDYYIKDSGTSAKKRRIALIELFGDTNKCLYSRRTHRGRLLAKNLNEFIFNSLIYEHEHEVPDEADIIVNFLTAKTSRLQEFLTFIQNPNRFNYPFEILERLGKLANNEKANKMLKIEIINFIGLIVKMSNTGVGYLREKVHSDTLEPITRQIGMMLDSQTLTSEDVSSLALSEFTYIRKIAINHSKCSRLSAITGALLGNN